MIKTIFLFFGFLFIPSLIYAQLFPYNPREMNTNYTYTKFSDSFNGTLLDKSKWEVTIDYGRGKCVFLDSEGTTYSVNNGLNLNMIYNPGHCYTEFGKIECKDYISAEINSREKFKYGIYEGRMKFANGCGSWPAFWFYGGSGADDPQYNTNGYASEIDIAEYNWHNPLIGPYTVTTDHVFHWWWPVSIHGTREMNVPFGKKENSTNWNNTSHTFKLIYTPYDVKFYIDGALNWRRSRFYTVAYPSSIDIFYEDINENTTYFEYEWFPKHEGQIKLSQQVAGNVDNDDIVAPQTSLFEWVTFRQFFLAPEIICPTIICTSTTATLDVDPDATNITWKLTPPNLFSGATSGTGKVVNITASSIQGKGKLTYTFNMSSDKASPKETYTAVKDIWIKGPDASETSFDVYKSNGVRATQVGNTFLMCPNTTYQIYVMNSGPVPLSNYTWTIPSAWTRNYTSGNMISVYTNSSPGGQVIVNATNTACNTTVQVITGYMGSTTSCGSYYMSFTPNPATSETTIVLTADGEKSVTENTQWELEAYDQQQGVKEKETKIKGKQTKLNTSNWKEGVYIVRAKIGEEIISEKLVVKH